MLRRRLLLILGSLVLLLLAVAISAVLLLQSVLNDLTHMRTQALVAVDRVSELGNQVAITQTELYRLQAGSQYHLDQLLDAAEAIQEHVAYLDTLYLIRASEIAPAFADLRTQLPVFFRQVGTLATSQDVEASLRENEAALVSAIRMNQDILRIGQYVRQHAQEEQGQMVHRLRIVVLGLAIAFLLLINISILLLLRAASMVLSPVERLVEASRALAREEFDHRVNLEQQDEFAELANAYNSLAAELQQNEQRRLEMLGQVALTLNHELNNAMAIIELQLELLHRSSKGDPKQEKYLRQIRESLERMQQTVDSLKRVRRIVLTDYVGGVKMLDLQRSVQEDVPRQEGAT